MTFNLDEESSLLATDARLFNPSFFHLCLNNEVLSVLVIICPLLLSYRKMFQPEPSCLSGPTRKMFFTLEEANPLDFIFLGQLNWVTIRSDVGRGSASHPFDHQDEWLQ
jgi:hypothetical protein